MALKLMCITNRPEIAQIAETAGVDTIFIDLEYIGKLDRQGGMDTVQSHHTLNDVLNIRRVISKSELLVRCNPIHDGNADYTSTEQEIDGIIENGADTVMLPFFKTVAEVDRFLSGVSGRAKTMLLFETPASVEHADEILSLPFIDYVHIGLNDMSLGYHKKFMFELLTDGTVEKLAEIIRRYKIPFGFGGIASIGKGMLPSEYVIREHYRLGSTAAILSRSFCNCDSVESLEVIGKIFSEGLLKIREFEKTCPSADFYENSREIRRRVEMICEEKNEHSDNRSME